MVGSLCKELRLRKNYIPKAEKIRSIYFGGGTPSLLNGTEISKIFQTIEENFDLSSLEEITLEANPDDIDKAQLELWRSLRINRLSIGIQSFDDDILKFLNRTHTAQKAIESIKISHRFDFNNLNLDLIYGIPGQSIDSLQRSLDHLLELNPSHISAYSLTIEENTVFGRWSRDKKIPVVSEDTIAQHYDMVLNRLFETGFEQYEVSNFSFPGKESIHNSSYWKQDSYLGIGPSAHSYNKATRHINIQNNAKYIKMLSDDELPAKIEFLSNQDKFEEYVLTSIRTKWGTSLGFIEDNFGFRPSNTLQNFLNQSSNAGYIKVSNDHIYLTPKGKLIADEVTIRLFDHFI